MSVEENVTRFRLHYLFGTQMMVSSGFRYAACAVRSFDWRCFTSRSFFSMSFMARLTLRCRISSASSETSSGGSIGPLNVFHLVETIS